MKDFSSQITSILEDYLQMDKGWNVIFINPVSLFVINYNIISLLIVPSQTVLPKTNMFNDKKYCEIYFMDENLLKYH